MYDHSLKTFIVVADQGSFAKAAEELYISSSAVVQQINALEVRCGFRLFYRSNRGVLLTPAGESFYQDTRMIITLSEAAIARAKGLDGKNSNIIRVGISLLFKARLLIEIWRTIGPQLPGVKLELIPVDEERYDSYCDLGAQIDVIEGIFYHCSAAQDETTHFLELDQTPICCAIPKGDCLASKEYITFNDLEGRSLVMLVEGVFDGMDLLRTQLLQKCPSATIVDSHHYGMDTFAQCEVNSQLLITPMLYKDIHADLVTVPLDTNITQSYGLIYSNHSSPDTLRFMELVKKNYKQEYTHPIA